MISTNSPFVETDKKPNTDFVPFDSLEVYEPKTKYLLLLRDVSKGVIKSVNELEQLSTVLQLRRMRRFQRGLFDLAFDDIGALFVEKFINQSSLRSKVLVHSLLFVKEIFSNQFADFNDSWLKFLYPPVEDLIFCSNKEISQLAKEVIKTYIENMKQTTAIQVLFSSIECIDQSKPRELFVYETIEEYFNNTDRTYLLYGFDWNEILEKLPPDTSAYYSLLQRVFQLLKTLLNDTWGKYLIPLSDKNKALVNKLISPNTISH